MGRIYIDRLGGLNIGEKHISLKAFIDRPEDNIQIEKHSRGFIHVNGKEISCKVNSVSHQLNRRQVTLNLHRRRELVDHLWPVIYHDVQGIYLLLGKDGRKDRDKRQGSSDGDEIRQEVAALLSELSELDGRTEAEILAEYTAWKYGIKPITEIDKVSVKQLHVLKRKFSDKLKELRGSNSYPRSAEGEPPEKTDDEASGALSAPTERVVD